MRILVIGDVVSSSGCTFLRRHLPSLKRMKKIDLCIANGENSAPGNGILPGTAEHLFDSGVDFITTGNHVYNRREAYDMLDDRQDIIRPANYYGGNPGKGCGIIDMGRTQVGVINLLGNSFMGVNTENAFICAERTIEELKKSCSVIVVDFHAEATGEKRSMGFFLDGKVSVVFGTHTHVQTADEQILPCGTGYITDVGMVGPKQSVLGVKPEIIISKMRTNMPARFDVEDTENCILNGCIFEVDEKTGKTLSVERVAIE
ncbi:MAG: TIGR00282 family metallophosphoesterase [Clostridia bacterium]|nr:TIGR00282 family metallophosphoesterase [Clostridia bacterium]